MRRGAGDEPAIASDRGAVTAEFVVTLPALLVVFLLAVGAIMASTHRLALTSASAEVARLEARGDVDAASARLAQLHGQVSVQRATRGPLLCVTLTSAPGNGLLKALTVSATGCAAKVSQ